MSLPVRDPEWLQGFQVSLVPIGRNSGVSEAEETSENILIHTQNLFPLTSFKNRGISFLCK